MERLASTQCFYGCGDFDNVQAKLKMQTVKQPLGARRSPPGNLPETGPVSLPPADEQPMACLDHTKAHMLHSTKEEYGLHSRESCKSQELVRNLIVKHAVCDLGAGVDTCMSHEPPATKRPQTLSGPRGGPAGRPLHPGQRSSWSGSAHTLRRARPTPDSLHEFTTATQPL